MNTDDFKHSIFEQFEKYQLYRRLIVLFACALILYTTIKSFDLAFASIDSAGYETAAIIAAIQVPVSAIMTFISKLYWGGKNADNFDS